MNSRTGFNNNCLKCNVRGKNGSYQTHTVREVKPGQKREGDILSNFAVKNLQNVLDIYKQSAWNINVCLICFFRKKKSH